MIAALGTAQTIAWASTYYLPAILAVPMARDLGVSAHPLGAAVLIFFGAPAATAFALLHGAGNGIMTIANGTLPLALFGPAGDGRRQGLLMLPARIGQAFAPWLFGLCLYRWGEDALWVSASLGLAACTALFLLRASPQKART